MVVTREELYFEPRCIDTHGSIRWYGERYTDYKLGEYIEYTVYIRDDGRYLYIYKLGSENSSTEEKIKAELNLICKLKKHDEKSIYGHRYV